MKEPSQQPWSDSIQTIAKYKDVTDDERTDTQQTRHYGEMKIECGRKGSREVTRADIFICTNVIHIE